MSSGAKNELRIVGLLSDHAFHQAKCCVEGLHTLHPEKFSAPVITGLLEFEWDLFLQEHKKALRGETWAFEDKVMVFENGELLGGTDELNSKATNNWEYNEFRPETLYAAMATEAYKNYIIGTRDTFVYLDVSVGQGQIGRLLLQLYTQKCPKTCENFIKLCTGEKGTKKDETLMRYHYKDTLFHRVVPNGWIQGGDILYGKGNGGESIYGVEFEDENFSVRHNSRGILGMANKGRHTNGSQFYITCQPTPWMDTKYVAFGKVVEGTEVLNVLEAQETYNERPKAECKITDCGIFTP